MKKIILFSLVLFSIMLHKNNLYSEDNIIYPLKKPILNPEVKEKKISKNIIKPLKKPIIKKVEKKPKEEKIKEKKVTKLEIIVLPPASSIASLVVLGSLVKATIHPPPPAPVSGSA